MSDDYIIQTKVPKKLAEFIDKLTEEGYFTSRDDFARCSMEIIAQLYGLAASSPKGKSLLDILSDNGKITTKSVTTSATNATATNTDAITQNIANDNELTPIEYDILDLFVGATFEFEDALHAKYTMELMKMAKPPLPKNEFIDLLDKLASKKKIEKGEHAGKIIWKILEKY
ncbi:MAG: hypothetical protein FK734_06465 [Asgard group archaeon]|nr:hypothetical protein [Asgard group archaeon]